MLLSLMIVDDEKEIRTGLANYIPWEEIGYQVVCTAGDGVQALQYLKSHPVDVIFTDIRMPEMNGIELAKRVMDCYPETVVVFLSGYADFSYAKKGMEYNVKNYVVKPTVYQELFDVFTKIRSEREASISLSDEEVNYYSQTISRVKQFINENLREVTLESAAEYIGLNPHYLSSFFKQHAGERFSEYLNQQRMQRAKLLLEEGTLRVYEIGDAVGYRNANNFARAFKTHYGITPKEYRGRHRNKGEQR